MTDELLAALRARANHRGLVLARSEALQETLRCSFQQLERALAALSESGTVEVLSPLPFLVLALRPPSWRGNGRSPAGKALKLGPPKDRAYSFQSSLSQQEQLKESYRQPLGDEDALLREVLETLGETDPTTFRGALRVYSPGVIRTTLTRIRKMKHVRKNRTALFRYLLPRIAKEPPSSN